MVEERESETEKKGLAQTNQIACWLPESHVSYMAAFFTFIIIHSYFMYTPTWLLSCSYTVNVMYSSDTAKSNKVYTLVQ